MSEHEELLDRFDVLEDKLAILTQQVRDLHARLDAILKLLQTASAHNQKAPPFMAS